MTGVRSSTVMWWCALLASFSVCAIGIVTDTWWAFVLGLVAWFGQINGRP